MENASKALLMAAGVLIGVLILALMVTLFASSKSLFNSYDATKESEAIQQFNVNFTKYLGKDLTIHEVLTIYNFAIGNGFLESDIIKNGSFDINLNQISTDREDENDYYIRYGNKRKVLYKMEIIEVDQSGYVSKIKFSRSYKYP